MKALEKVKRFIAKNTPLEKKDSLLVALSGGPDSQVLLSILKECGYHRLTAVHINYHTRGEASDLDEKCAENWARELHVPFIKKNRALTNPKGNFQALARKVRYDCFEDIMKKNNIDYLITGHHKGDQHETMVMRFFSGTRSQGLLGIRSTSKRKVRPLLCLDKKEILLYAKKHQVPYRVDETNTETHYLRNFLRHEILARLESKIKNLGKRLDTTHHHIRREHDLLDFFSYHYLVQHAYWKKNMLIFSTKGLPHSDATVALLCFLLNINANQAKQVLLSEKKQVHSYPNWRLTFYDDKIWIQKSIDSKPLKEALSIQTLPFEIQIPGGTLTATEVSHFDFTSDANIEFIPLRSKNPRLTICKWKQGDKIEIKAGHHKKVSDVLNEKKLSPMEKENICCLWNETKLLWVIGVRLSLEAYARPSDTHFMKLRYTSYPTRNPTMKDIKNFFLR